MAKILLVDDDQSLTAVYEAAFKKNGFEIVISHSGKGGLEMAKTQNPDLILLDQILPDLQGNEVLKTLKEDEKLKTIPVAILSNFGQNELVQAAINSGAEDYILKYQAEPDDVIKKVNEILKQKATKSQ